MVKFYDTTHTHTYPFPTVTLAYFLRYPNPYSTHVLSTDVISRHFDPTTQRLYTARLHLKRSKIPSTLLKLLPRSILGVSAADSGSSQSYILERSVVDVRDGVMVCESRNLEFTGVLAVVERQVYRRPGVDLRAFFARFRPMDGFGLMGPAFHSPARTPTTSSSPSRAMLPGVETNTDQQTTTEDEETDVTTKVELCSQLGQVRERFQKARAAAAKAGGQDSDMSALDDDPTAATAAAIAAPPPKMGLFRSWGTASIQRSIEAIGLRRTERAVPKSKEGMNVVLARLRHGGLVAVLEGMRRDSERVES